MIKGIYTAALGMLPRMVKQEIMANNLANLNTLGFKKDKLYFRKLLDSVSVLTSTRGDLRFTPGLCEESIDFSQGQIKQTQRSLDFAIQGEGFFTIQTPNGIRYTRNGNFTINSGGLLVTQQGFPVLGEGGPIEIMRDKEMVVNENGEITQEGVPIDRFLITAFDEPYPLIKEGNTLFMTDPPDIEGRRADNFRIKQGFLELSNVEPISEMVNMIEVMKNHELSQRVIRLQDETLERIIETARMG